MEFTLEELESILEEMGFSNIPDSQLEDFSKDLKRLIRHDVRTKNKCMTSMNTVPSADAPIVQAPTAANQSSKNDDRKPKSNDSDERNVREREHQKSSDKNAKQKELLWKKLKSDPVRLHNWYKTFWDIHGLK